MWPAMVQVRWWGSWMFALLPVEELPQFGDLLGRELCVFDKMREHRRNFAAKDALQKRAALLAHASLARDGGAVEITVAVGVELQGALFDQPVEHRFDRARVPRCLRRRQCLDDLTGRDGI